MTCSTVTNCNSKHASVAADLATNHIYSRWRSEVAGIETAIQTGSNLRSVSLYFDKTCLYRLQEFRVKVLNGCGENNSSGLLVHYATRPTNLYTDRVVTYTPLRFFCCRYKFTWPQIYTHYHIQGGPAKV